MDQALVQNTEDKEHSAQRGEHENGLAAQRLLIRLECACEKAMYAVWGAEIPLHLLYGCRGVAECHTRPKIEGDSDRWKEAGMVDLQGGSALVHPCHIQQLSITREGLVRL